MQRIAIYLVLALIFVIGGFYLRAVTAGHDPDEWHVDPFSVERPITPNTYYVAPQAMVDATTDMDAPLYRAPGPIMAKAFHDFVLTQPNTTLIAGDPVDGWMTYVQRTPVLRMPDYITVKFIDFDGGDSTLAIYSRSRYGHGDMGVNKARIDMWLQSLSSFEE